MTIGKLENTPVGRIWIAASNDGLVGISLWDEPEQFLADVARVTDDIPDPAAPSNPIVRAALAELDAYLRGELREFTTPIEWTILKPFQREVLEKVMACLLYTSPSPRD